MPPGADVPLRKYRIERYLAEGGMGAIYVGKKLGASGFEKEVVLKQLLPEFTSRPEFRDLFYREAKISASLDHVNIVRTYDLVHSDDAVFIVMEYVRGADLRTVTWRARLRRKALSPQAILHVGMEILASLAYAHGRTDGKGRNLGIIHRDVSPSNILCSGQGDVKLSDFGIAKARSFASVFYKVRGKVGYMSPEQARNQPIDGRSDVFSLAVCLFEALTGERLFVGDLQTPPEQIYGQAIPSLAERCPGLPPALEPVLLKALATEPIERFQDASAFGSALRQVARNHNLLYSARQLAAELTELLGPRPENWMFEEMGSVDTERIPVPRPHEGKEAAAISFPNDGSGPRRNTPHAVPPASVYEPTPLLELSPVTPAISLVSPLAPVAESAPLAFGPTAQTPPRGWSRIIIAAVLVGCAAAGAALYLLDRDPIDPGGVVSPPASIATPK